MTEELDQAQSVRGRRNWRSTIDEIADEHMRTCFASMLEREASVRLTHAVFYHSYSLPAPLYEVQSVIASLLFGFPVERGILPRIVAAPFTSVVCSDDLKTLLPIDPNIPNRDHDVRFRQVAIGATMSLLEPRGSEAAPLDVFKNGYSCNDVKFVELLRDVLSAIGIDDQDDTDGTGKSSLDVVYKSVLRLCQTYGVSAIDFKGFPNFLGGGNGGLLQVLVPWDMVDRVAYRAKPFGIPADDVQTLSQYMSSTTITSLEDGTGVVSGQVRIVADPTLFLSTSNGEVLQVHLYSGSHAYHHELRPKLIRDLTLLLNPYLDSVEKKQLAIERFGLASKEATASSTTTTAGSSS